jgi:hypothetical protein
MQHFVHNVSVLENEFLCEVLLVILAAKPQNYAPTEGPSYLNVEVVKFKLSTSLSSVS